MKIEQTSPYRYRVVKMYKGKRYRVTFDHKPTQKEALQALAEAMDSTSDDMKPSSLVTFDDYAKDYIQSKKNVLSPSTIAGYEGILRNLPEGFKKLRMFDIDTHDIQLCMNKYAAPYHPWVSSKMDRRDETKTVTRSPKTVRNAHGFISAVMGEYRPKLNCKSRLPQKKKNDFYIPSDEDIKKVLNEFKGTIYEYPFKLACFGLRRSELIAVTDKSIKKVDGKYLLSIKNAIVRNSDKKWVKKTTKSTASTREIKIPDDIAEYILKNGKVISGHPDKLYKNMDRTQKKLGLEHFSVHKLRHYFCSKLFSLGYDIKTVQAMGGWETDHTPRTVYAHVMQNKLEEAKDKASDQIADALF